MVDFSIIIPTYNSEKTITKTIDSIVYQDGICNYEIICIDDGSNDGTWKVLQQLANKHASVKCYRQHNQKQAVARNNGLKRANGRYILFADADDYWLPGLYQTIVDKKIDSLLIFGIEKDYEKSTIVENKSGMSSSKNQKELIQNYLSNNLEMDVGVWNKVFLKTVIDQNQLCFSNGNFFEDSLFVLEYLTCIDAKKIQYVNKVFYVLNKHSNTTTSQFSPDIIKRAEIYVQRVKIKLKKINLSKLEEDEIINALKCRLILHISHHYMLHSDSWSPKWERNFLKRKLKFRGVFLNSIISYKYKIAFLGLELVPSIYKYAYVNYKPSI